MLVSKKQFVVTVFFLFVIISFISYSQNKSGNAFGEAEIIFDKDGLSPVEIRFKEGASVTKANFFNQYKTFFGLPDDYEFGQVQELTDQLGQTHYRFSEFYKGVEVLYAQLVLHEKNGIIHYVNGQTVHRIDVNVSPSVTEQAGLQAALNHINAEAYMWQKEENENFLKSMLRDPDATYYPKGELKLTSGPNELTKNNLELVYRFDIYSDKPRNRNYVDVNAVSGEIVNVISRIHSNDVPGTGMTLYNGSVNITIDSFEGAFRLRENWRGSGIQTFDMQNGTNYNAAVDFMDEDINFTDPDDGVGVSVHWATEGTYDYYLSVHNRNSYNNTGGTLYTFADYGDGYNNAFWDGFGMTYGSGDGINFTEWGSVDIVGHEITHGVTDYSAGLIYQSESGALNESFSDIFGTAVEFYLEGAGTADWVCGEDITLEGFGYYPGVIRSMENPNFVYCPDTYGGLYWDENEEVHTNSGVQNFWFYLLSVGGTGVNDNGDSYSVSGIGIGDASKIAYRNLTVYLTPTSEYFHARAASLNSAIDLFGLGSQQYQSVIDAWDAVGVSSVHSDFTASISCGQVPLLVQFTDLSGAAPGVITSWEWDFNNDGITDATEQNPSWTYNELGIYTVSLTVSTGAITNTLTKADYIVSFNPGSVLVWEGQQGGTNFSGTFIRDYLQSNSREMVYLNSEELPFPMTGFDAVFLSYGNWGIDGTTFTPLTNNNAETITEYLQSGGYLYLDGGEALGYDQSFNTSLLNLFGISSASDGIENNTPVTNLAGQTGTLTEGMLFTSNSQQTNNYIDIYVPNSTGLIAFNQSGVGDVAIQNTGSFGQRTFCFSYALGKLNDGIFPSTKENLLKEILEFFNIVVPVELTSFIGNNINGNVILNWSTASEINNRVFEIERASSSATPVQDWRMIGYVNGKGTTTEQQEYSFVDKNISAGKHFYRLKQIDFDGTFEYSNEIEVNATTPLSFSLEQNYPNPFNPSTKITYSIPDKSFVTLKVYDPLGREVFQLVNEEKEAGRYEINFSATGGNASELSSGVYFYRVEATPNGGRAGNFIETKKMILLR